MQGYYTAFEAWKSVCSRLENVVQEFADACAMLNDALIVPPSSVPAHQFRERTLVELDRQLASSGSYEQALQRARLSLNPVRNTSHTLCPISSLPSDLLGLILASAFKTNAVIQLSSVCRAWRDLIVQSPTFWTSLELCFNLSSCKQMLPLAALWAERGQQTAMTLTLNEIRPDSRDNVQNKPEFFTSIQSLPPLMRRVRTLNIWLCHIRSPSVLRALLECWVAHGASAKTTTLYIKAPVSHNVTHIPRDAAGATVNLRPRDFTDSLGSLRRLRLRGIWIGWSELIHAGLVELRIEYVANWCPRQRDIVEMLNSAPRLRVLSIIHVTVEKSGAPLGTVTLDELETLRLDQWRLLGAIESASENLEMNLNLRRAPNLSVIRSFFARTRITRLFLCTKTPVLFPVEVLLTPLHHVRTLALDGFRPNIEMLANAIESVLFDIWPELRELHMIDCFDDPEVLRQLILIHPPRVLTRSSTGNDSWDTSPVTRALVESMLSDTGVEVVWIDSPLEHPTNSWKSIFQSDDP